MISILIPIYNFDVRQLVVDLHHQCITANIPFEIRCYDDGSRDEFKQLHQSIQLSNVIYREMSHNLGRSAIRNRLGQSAIHPYLLFMDGDSKVVRPDYIAKYLTHLSSNKLIYGGRCYNPVPPDESELMFHWSYGIHREQSTVEQRKQQAWHSFMTNNFLIPKSSFLNHPFEESLKQYGHEDTLFGLQLAQSATEIEHIDNPLEHIGLESAEVFLHKTELGLENLYTLWNSQTAIDTRLLQYFKKVKSWRVDGLIANCFKRFKPFLLKRINSTVPSLFHFDLYKLGFLCQLHQQQTKG